MVGGAARNWPQVYLQGNEKAEERSDRGTHAASSDDKYAKYDTIERHGEVQEWLNWHAWKVCKGAILSRVRIPLSPPD